jgi:hypothetical protein
LFLANNLCINHFFSGGQWNAILGKIHSGKIFSIDMENRQIFFGVYCFDAVMVQLGFSLFWQIVVNFAVLLFHEDFIEFVF